MAVLTSTHNLCFRAKIRKQCLPFTSQFYYIKVGTVGAHLHGRVILMNLFNESPTFLCDINFASVKYSYTYIFHICSIKRDQSNNYTYTYTFCHISEKKSRFKLSTNVLAVRCMSDYPFVSRLLLATKIWIMFRILPMVPLEILPIGYHW